MSEVYLGPGALRRAAQRLELLCQLTLISAHVPLSAMRETRQVVEWLWQQADHQEQPAPRAEPTSEKELRQFEQVRLAIAIRDRDAWAKEAKLAAQENGKLEAALQAAVEALDRLSVLGNGQHPGTSEGNTLAQAALNKVARMRKGCP